MAEHEHGWARDFLSTAEHEHGWARGIWNGWARARRACSACSCSEHARAQKFLTLCLRPLFPKFAITVAQKTKNISLRMFPSIFFGLFLGDFRLFYLIFRIFRAFRTFNLFNPWAYFYPVVLKNGQETCKFDLRARQFSHFLLLFHKFRSFQIFYSQGEYFWYSSSVFPYFSGF